MRVAAFRSLFGLTVELGAEFSARQRYDRAYWQYVERIPQSTRKATLARYDTDAYRRAITYGITKASKAGLDITAIASYFSTKLSRMRSKMSVERLAL